MKKVPKGDYGYIRYQQKRRILITIVMFLIPVTIFLTGYVMTGTRKNMFTLIAILGCLPASKAAVGMILICMQKPIDAALYQALWERAKNLTVIYDGTVSSYEKNMPMACMAICGLNVMCLTLDPKVKPAFAEEHIKKILQGNSYRANVKVFTDTDHYLRRLDELSSHQAEWENVPFKPDPRYPGATRAELVKHVLLSICV